MDGVTVTVEQSSVAVKVCCAGRTALQVILAIAVGVAVNTGGTLSLTVMI
jgi:hypothetical protein